MAEKFISCFFLITLSCSIAQFTNADFEQNLNQLMERVSKLENENACLQSDMKKLILRLDGQETKNENEEIRNEDCEYPVSKPKRLLFRDGDVVAFTAVIKPVYVQSFDNGETIVFETVLTNLGGAYSSGDGIFVAPVNGLYMFSCSVLDDHVTETLLHAEIAVNDVAQARIFAHAEKGIYRDQGAQTIFLMLNQGDHVRVRHIDQDNGTVGGELYSSFSGYLIRVFE